LERGAGGLLALILFFPYRDLGITLLPERLDISHLKALPLHADDPDLACLAVACDEYSGKQRVLFEGWSAR